MNPARPIVDLRSRDWRGALKSALNHALAEPVPQNIDATMKGLK